MKNICNLSLLRIFLWTLIGGMCSGKLIHFHTKHDNGVYNSLSQWLLSCNGEFIIVIVDKSSQELVLFNDLLGILPFFNTIYDNKIFMSRDTKYIISLNKQKQLDPIGMAEYLIFCFMPLPGSAV